MSTFRNLVLAAASMRPRPPPPRNISDIQWDWRVPTLVQKMGLKQSWPVSRNYDGMGGRSEKSN